MKVIGETFLNKYNLKRTSVAKVFECTIIWNYLKTQEFRDFWVFYD